MIETLRSWPRSPLSPAAEPEPEPIGTAARVHDGFGGLHSGFSQGNPEGSKGEIESASSGGLDSSRDAGTGRDQSV